jgi:hypothetical protein
MQPMSQALRGLVLTMCFFVWDHTNFAERDAMKYSLHALEHKETYVRPKLGKLILIQKSSCLVPGDCAFSPQRAYDIIVGRGAQTIRATDAAPPQSPTE